MTDSLTPFLAQFSSKLGPTYPIEFDTNSDGLLCRRGEKLPAIEELASNCSMIITIITNAPGEDDPDRVRRLAANGTRALAGMQTDFVGYAPDPDVIRLRTARHSEPITE